MGFFVLLLVLLLAGSAAAVDTMEVHFLDVGQADASLLLGPEFAVLVDAGDYRRSDVVPHLEDAGVDSLDLLIGTHPHADHIGQFPQVLERFPVTEVWMSGDTHTTRTFERALDAILASDAGYHEPRAGEVLELGALRIEVLNPAELTGDLHEGSISFRAVYGSTAFVFTGDAEVETEWEIIEGGHDLAADVLHLGHHGSRTSTSIEFLDAVSPTTAVYSAGIGNHYGHPHQEVVDRVLDAGIDLYGTDTYGTIVIKTDGTSYTVQTAYAGPSDTAAVEAPAEPLPEPEVAPDTLGVNVNKASLQELMDIVHIGQSRAEQIMELRPFSCLDDLTRVSGIGPARLQDIKDQGLAYAE